MENYMKVEDVLRYLKKNALPINQYKIEGYENHFFKSEDVKNKITDHLFREMECYVVTYMVTSKEEHTLAFNQGWNANISDYSIFTNPNIEFELYRSWSEGWRACEKQWLNLPLYQSQPTRK